MNNFGVIELASAKTTSAPGWAYVPDNTISRSTAPANRKRARNVPGLTYSDLTARQDNKIRKEVEALDKDGGKDNTIPLPVKSGRGMCRRIIYYSCGSRLTSGSARETYTQCSQDFTIAENICKPSRRLPRDASTCRLQPCALPIQHIRRK
jgi:hypothetical protein